MTPDSDTHITVLLDQEACHDAARFAADQVSPQKGRRVYLNTLAVRAMSTYLGWLGIPTDLQKSDCWQAGLRVIFDVADIVLPGVGKLECRPVLPEETKMTLSLTTEGARLAYVAVRVSEDLKEAKLLGFIRASDAVDGIEEIPLEQLKPLEGFARLPVSQTLIV